MHTYENQPQPTKASAQLRDEPDKTKQDAPTHQLASGSAGSPAPMAPAGNPPLPGKFLPATVHSSAITHRQTLPAVAQLRKTTSGALSWQNVSPEQPPARMMLQPQFWDASASKEDEAQHASEGAGSTAQVVQRVVIPKAVSGGARDVDTDDESYHTLLETLDEPQLVRVIIFLENQPDHDGFDVVYAYNKLWPLVGPEPRRHNEVVDYLNQRIPHKLARIKSNDDPSRAGGGGRSDGSAAAVASPLAAPARPPMDRGSASGDQRAPEHVAINISERRPEPAPPEMSAAPPMAAASGAPRSSFAPPPVPGGSGSGAQAPHAVPFSPAQPGGSGGGVEMMPAPAAPGLMPVPPASVLNGPDHEGGVSIHIDGGGSGSGGRAPDDGGGPPDAGGGAAAAPPVRGWERLRRKGFGGTTIGDMSNSLGIASTAAGQVSSDGGLVGGFGIVGGIGVGAGGFSQIATSTSRVDTVKGSSNLASGVLGIAAGARTVAEGTTDFAASVLGRISAGAWGVAEAINFAQKAAKICENGIWTRDTLHALNSLIKATASFLIVGSTAQPILVLASILGGIGAASSVAVGLHKLYEIYQESGDPAAGPAPAGPDAV